jgi:hypothetical protein
VNLKAAKDNVYPRLPQTSAMAIYGTSPQVLHIIYIYAMSSLQQVDSKLHLQDKKSQ